MPATTRRQFLRRSGALAAAGIVSPSAIQRAPGSSLRCELRAPERSRPHVRRAQGTRDVHRDPRRPHRLRGLGYGRDRSDRARDRGHRPPGSDRDAGHPGRPHAPALGGPVPAAVQLGVPPVDARPDARSHHRLPRTDEGGGARRLAPGQVLGLPGDPAARDRSHEADLDELDTVRPILVHSLNGHTALANSRALELAGVTASTPDPPDGTIIREPTASLPGCWRTQRSDWSRARSPPRRWSRTLKRCGRRFAA